MIGYIADRYGQKQKKLSHHRDNFFKIFDSN